MTLGGLALVIGTLLDNNIVVQENLHRHLEMGKDGYSAAEESAIELTLPIFVATICILIVYLPIIFFSGIIKFLFVPLALTVAFAMVADYAVSMSVTPVVLARLYRRGHEPGDQSQENEGWFGRVQYAYVRLLTIGLRFKAHRPWCGCRHAGVGRSATRATAPYGVLSENRCGELQYVGHGP